MRYGGYRGFLKGRGYCLEFVVVIWGFWKDIVLDFGCIGKFLSFGVVEFFILFINCIFIFRN